MAVPTVDQIFEIVIDAALNGSMAARVAGQALDFSEGLENKTGVVMVDELVPAIMGVEPGAIRILDVKDKTQGALSGLPVFVRVKTP